jgi:TATA-box binding protein (TBP) (component of TFIID and TFIIIB)
MNKESNMRVVNMIVQGLMPVTRRFTTDEVSHLIKNSELKIYCTNETKIPNFVMRMNKFNESESNMGIIVWYSGKFSIFGVKTEKDADEVYNKTFEQLKKYCGKAFR